MQRDFVSLVGFGLRVRALIRFECEWLGDGPLVEIDSRPFFVRSACRVSVA